MSKAMKNEHISEAKFYIYCESMCDCVWCQVSHPVALLQWRGEYLMNNWRNRVPSLRSASCVYVCARTAYIFGAP